MTSARRAARNSANQLARATNIRTSSPSLHSRGKSGLIVRPSLSVRVSTMIDRAKRFEHGAPDHAHRDARPHRDERPRKAEAGFETFRVEVGHDHGVKPGNIVGAIANEAGLDSKNIGRIDIRDDHALVDLPEGMPPDIFKMLKKVWVSGQQLRITRNGDAPDNAERAPHFPPGAPKPRSAHKKSGRPAGFVKPKRPRKE